jgi:hypothetical protein
MCTINKTKTILTIYTSMVSFPAQKVSGSMSHRRVSLTEITELSCIFLPGESGFYLDQGNYGYGKHTLADLLVQQMDS